MANTTFSGPIRAGNIKDTTGTTVGTNVANIGQVVMTQSIMIDAAVAVGTTTYDVGVIPQNSQLLTVTIRVAIVSNAAGAATVSVGKTGSTQYLIANTNVKALGETSSIANGALDEVRSFWCGYSDNRHVNFRRRGSRNGSSYCDVYLCAGKQLAG